jgi:NhaP-type Na+/H+ or K+/H+ antiporter
MSGSLQYVRALFVVLVTLVVETESIMNDGTGAVAGAVGIGALAALGGLIV